MKPKIPHKATIDAIFKELGTDEKLIWDALFYFTWKVVVTETYTTDQLIYMFTKLINQLEDMTQRGISRN